MRHAYSSITSTGEATNKCPLSPTANNYRRNLEHPTHRDAVSPPSDSETLTLTEENAVSHHGCLKITYNVRLPTSCERRFGSFWTGFLLPIFCGRRIHIKIGAGVGEWKKGDDLVDKLFGVAFQWMAGSIRHTVRHTFFADRILLPWSCCCRAGELVCMSPVNAIRGLMDEDSCCLSMGILVNLKAEEASAGRWMGE